MEFCSRVNHMNKTSRAVVLGGDRAIPAVGVECA